MCGRYALFGDPNKMQGQYRAVNVLDWAPRYNLAPTDKVPILQLDSSFRRYFSLASWGLRGSSKVGASLLINARAETATEKPTFRTLARETRCVLPASGYYEWTKADSEKNPHFISSDLQKTLFWSFAGLVRVTEEDGELKQETVILTKPATPQLESIHHRMPVLLAPEQVQDWLNPNLSFPLDLAMAAGNSENIETRRVSTKLNHVGAEGADLLEPPPASVPRQPSLF